MYLTTATTTTITLCTYPPPPPALPFELISLIIQATHPTKASLSNYALVSKSWTYPAQHLLFQHLSLHSQSDYLSFQYAIQRTPALANTVRSIRVLIDSNQPRPQGGGVSQFQFGQVVQVCEGLNEVDISLFGEASFEEGLIAKLRSRPGLSSLRFMNWSGDVYALVQLLSGCRFLQNLVVGGSTPPEVPLRAVSSDGDGDGEIDASFSAASFPCTLTKLGLVFQRSPSIEFFRWLLDNSKESLKVLDVERELEGWATAATTSHRSSPALVSSTQVLLLCLHPLPHRIIVANRDPADIGLDISIIINADNDLNSNHDNSNSAPPPPPTHIPPHPRISIHTHLFSLDSEGLPLSTIGGIGAGVGGVMRSLLIRRTGTGPGTGTGEAGLEHLAFGIDSDTSLQEEEEEESWVLRLQHHLLPPPYRRLPSQELNSRVGGRLRLRCWKKHGYGHKQIASLRMACAMAGVELKLVGASASAREEGGVKQFRALVRDR
ncbi:hypothetical protein D9757_015196 [Collybiopsis confluens]|uniref:F-box domain-containing protein n=1 Tax=Collybiopsis confluens TaxID=2823264 RepID=A0A8H5FK14_9AGAR|nr:hypothetical protein D9757_015196 [Collybiopsis confluens]